MFSHLCRACLTQFNHPSEIVPLFEPHENVVYHRICNELQLLVQQDDQLGCNVCKQCSGNILKFYKFVLTYRESDRKLREMLKIATVAVGGIKTPECKPNITDFVQHVQHTNSFEDAEMMKTELEDCDAKEFTPKTPIPDPIANQWKCSTCSSEFRTRYKLRNHRKSHQVKLSETNILKTSTTQSQCTICLNEFTSRKELEVHKMERHSGVGKSNSDETDEYECDICSKTFNTRKKISLHLITHINDSRRKFLCVACGNQFCSKFGLTQHIRAIHDKEQRFQCTKCDRRFAHKHNLKTHMNRHNGHRPYSCNVCDKTFYDSSTLNVHTKSVHSDTNPYVCSICSKGFNRNGNLKMHMVRTHHIQHAKLQGSSSSQRVIMKVEVKLK